MMKENRINTDKVEFLGLNGECEGIFKNLHTPCYVIDEARLIENGRILLEIQKRTGCKILLAQKAFSNYDLYNSLAPFLAGTAASGLYEARLGKETLPQKECHVFSAAYRDDEFEEILKWADHIVFNTPGQLKKYGKKAKAAGKSVGLRINPQCSTQKGNPMYDPCSDQSRLGTTRAQWDKEMTEAEIELLEGIHFHTLCEQDADALATTLEAVEERWKDVLCRVKWLNMGGGHHITKKGYQLEVLEHCIQKMQRSYNVEVYLEPGEAVAFHAGYLVTSVLDVFSNEKQNFAILDMSAACHTPDVLEVPYKPSLLQACEEDEKGISYQLGGPTCLAGDCIGNYQFLETLKVGQQLVFGDMAIYSMCKNNTFNGMPLPNIYERKESGKIELLATFGYEDFKYRLGKKVL